MSARKPVVRHFIACEEVAASPDGRQISLKNIVFAIRAASYPRVHPRIDLFVQLSDAQGRFTFSVKLVFFHAPGEETDIPISDQPFILDLGDNPLDVHGFVRRLHKIRFDRSGLYEFRLLCDGEAIAQEPIQARVRQ